MNPLQHVLSGGTARVPPIWLMRQAGRYQQTYQRLRERYSFDELCREPDLSAQVACDAVSTFDFDAAILFSDLLYPLEALGFGLSYDSGGPKLDGSLTLERLEAFRSTDEALSRLSFQERALAATRRALPRDKGLIGFVGGPWTLFVYAVEGSHTGSLVRSKSAPRLYRAFADRVVPLLTAMIDRQLAAGADLVMVLDTAAGELAPQEFARLLGADLACLARTAPGPVGYYSKALHPAHFEEPAVAALPFAGFGFDARWNLRRVLQQPARRGFVQGNFDQALLHLEPAELARAIDRFLRPLRDLDVERRRGWICGLGHGVLPGTPETNVHRFLEHVREGLQ